MFKNLIAPIVGLMTISSFALSDDTIASNFTQSSKFIEGSAYYYNDLDDVAKDTYLYFSPSISTFVQDGISVGGGVEIYRNTSFSGSTKTTRYTEFNIHFDATKWYGYEGLMTEGLVYKAGVFGTLGSWKSKNLIADTYVKDNSLSFTPFVGANYFLTPRASLYTNLYIGSFDLQATEKFNSRLEARVGVSYYIANSDKITPEMLKR